MELILYSKPDCHLCEGLAEKLSQVTALAIAVEVRDITSQADWFEAFEYEVPVLYWRSTQGEIQLPRLSPRGSVQQLEKMLLQYQSS